MEYRQNKAGWQPRSPRIDAKKYEQDEETERLSFSSEMEVAKFFSAPPNLKVRFVSCNESAIKRWLSSELEETVFSLTHELFMTKHHTVTLSTSSLKESGDIYHSILPLAATTTKVELRPDTMV